ncbi:general transcription factor IIE subunit 1-like [Oppia nitens]|uniref:general transcription factor IIE subunit 1-like n=1 Tax=Oppia nitens TaxID=1686743 RepID=UPI0023DBBB47|nr:general transcription factor IIE subunit 1-like [Oppia nitens]
MSVDIPRSLKHLVQRVMRGFYPIDHVIVVDLLLRKRLIKEDDIIELLKFERKQLRSVLAALEKDKLTKKKLKIETATDGKANRHNYYYINFKAFVNVVKYKLDHMRKKLELEERDLTARASFVCDDCHKTFTDLEVDQLLDPMTGDMRCSYCVGEVKEDPNHMPKADSRLLVAKFNQTMEPLWLLLKDVEDIRLSNDLLEPEIQVSSESGPQTQNNNSNNSMAGRQWTDKNRAINSEYENSVLNDHKNYMVKIEDSNTDEANGSADQHLVRAKKEQPSWMLESTVSNINNTINLNSNNDTSITISTTSKTSNKFSSKSMSNLIQTNSFENNEPSKEILETLLIHEKTENNNSSAVSMLLNETTNHLTNSYNNNIDNNEEEIMSEEEEEDNDNQQPIIIVGNQTIPLSEVNDEIISQMTDEERDEYIRLSQQVYAHMYDI